MSRGLHGLIIVLLAAELSGCRGPAQPELLAPREVNELPRRTLVLIRWRAQERTLYLHSVVSEFETWRIERASPER